MVALVVCALRGRHLPARIVRVKIAVLAIVVPGTPVIKVAISQRLNILFTSNLLQRCKKHCIMKSSANSKSFSRHMPDFRVHGHIF